MLEAVTSTNARFVLRAAQTAPKLEIRDARAESLGDGLYKIIVAVHNVGFLQTHVSEIAKTAGVAKPVTVELALADGAGNGTPAAHFCRVSYGYCPNLGDQSESN
jgi:hypothetical protein